MQIKSVNGRVRVQGETPLARTIDRVWLFFSSVKLTIVLLVVLGIAMGYGTVIETNVSNAAARIYVYRAWWFDTLIILLALNLIGCTLRRAPYRPHQAGWIITHIALLLIMAGSVITHRFGMQGQIAVKEGESESVFRLEKYDPVSLQTVLEDERVLPFKIKLHDFEQKMYPGSGMTSLFKSDVEVLDMRDRTMKRWDVILNHPLWYEGYKISQASWMDLDDGTQISIMGVSYDPGIPYIYTGSTILIFGMFMIYFVKPYLKRKFPPVANRNLNSLLEDTEMTTELREQTTGKA